MHTDKETILVFLDEVFSHYEAGLWKHAPDVYFSRTSRDTDGMMADAYLNAYIHTGSARYLERGLRVLDTLLCDKDFGGLGYTGWGLGRSHTTLRMFRAQKRNPLVRWLLPNGAARPLNPPETKYVYTTSYIGYAFFKGYTLTADSRYRDVMQEILHTYYERIGFFDEDPFMIRYSDAVHDRKITFLVPNVTALAVGFMGLCSRIAHINLNVPHARGMIERMCDRFDPVTCSWEYGITGKYENEQHVGMILEGLFYATRSLKYRSDDPVFDRASEGLCRRIFTSEGLVNGTLLKNTTSAIKALPQTLLVAKLLPYAFDPRLFDRLLVTVLSFKDQDFFVQNIRLQSYCARAVSYCLLEEDVVSRE